MLQALINGVHQGLMLSLLGLAFSLVYTTTRVFFVALGAVLTICPYLALTATSIGIPWPAAYLLAIVVCGGLSVVCEEAIHWPFDRKAAPVSVHMIGSLGAFLVLLQTTILIWGNDPQVLVAGLGARYEFVGLRVARRQLLGGMCSLLALLLMFFWLYRSQIGLQFRALASNQQLLAVFGRDIRNLRRLIFALSGALASVASLATAFDIGFDPTSAMRAVLFGVAAAVIGGRRSFLWAAIGGLLLGILRSQVVWHLSETWVDGVTFGILALCMFVLPEGLSVLTDRERRLEDQA